jgi:opacity protein-like surface antigen
MCYIYFDTDNRKRVPMKTTLLSCVIAFWLFASAASADSFELSFYAGWTAPTYEQSFEWDPDINLPTFPGIDIQQQGTFGLEARGGFTFAGSATYYFNDHIGIEGRLDVVDIKIDTVLPNFTTTIDLPAPLPPIGAELDLSEGAVEVDRLYPFSLNLKARTGGRARFVASGGLSYLPRLRATGFQTVSLGFTGLGNLPQLDIATVALGVEAAPDETDEGRLGFNVGAGLEIQLSEHLALVGDVRVFRFETLTLQWTRLNVPTTELEELLLEELEQELDPIEFEPTWFQVLGGFVVRF